ncbi:MAG: helicase-associated domain-containing protein [Planctomycetes bacterium]|nr:helicase-associated domain-containing protein [Planctomycetota bacterium]
MTQLTLRALLQGCGDDVLREAVHRWCGPVDGKVGRKDLAATAAAMEDERRVLERIGTLPRKLQDLLEVFFGEQGSVRAVHELFAEHGRNFKSRFDLEAALAALQREGFLWPTKDKRWASFESPCWAAPGELVACVLECRKRRQRLLQDSLTLQGHLDARFFRERVENLAGKGSAKNGAGKNGGSKADAAQKAADHARKIYKLYTMEGAMDQRLQKLPEKVRVVVDAVLHRHGGLASWDDLEQDVGSDDDIDYAFLGKSIEEAMLGTACSLDLAPLGIQPAERAVVIFHEVALHSIRRRGIECRPQVGEELVCGGDFASNVSRFLRELQQNKVLFTADGDLFKASQKRIAGMLLPVPGGFLAPEQLLEVLYRFCLQRRLIDRRGERSLRPTPAGLEFERASLADQVKMLLGHFVEDRSLPGEAYHQTRMRRVLLRLLRRAEPMLWQDVSVLPFLSRNAYLAQLEAQPTEEFFAARFQGGGYTPTESLQQMCWNLLIWIKKRLFPLGLVDIGLHGGRVTALRLSRLGAELLDADPAGKVGGTRSSVIVQPDFEVLVFPGDDVHDVVHQIDRFAHRTKSDHVHQFRIDEDSVRAGVADGLSAAQIVQELTDRARVPIPQNVLYSLEEWANKSPS